MTPGEVLSNSRQWSVTQGDCLKAMAELPDDSIDLLVTSPPYVDARLYLEDGEDMGIARGPQEWVDWMVEIATQASCVCRGLCAFVVEGRTKQYKYDCTPFLLMAELHKRDFNLRKPCVFRRNGIPGSGGPDWLRNDWEPVICLSRPGKLPWSDNTACGEKPRYKQGGECSYRGASGERVNKLRRSVKRRDKDGSRDQGKYVCPDITNPGNVLDCVVAGGHMGNRLAHENEAPYPEELVEFFVRSFCPPGGVTLDPFSGSGTTVAVAVACGRRGVGFDLRASQVKLARRRMLSVTPDMFEVKAAETPQALQGELFAT